MKNNEISKVCGGGVLKNNNIVGSQNNDILSFAKTLQNQKNIKNSISNFFAFSLIELSIVLIIIGLLVAGVTGGASLIRSAKVRAFMNELNGWKQAVYSFYASKGRLPGDLDGLGIIGVDSGQKYTSSSFQAPYNTYTPDYDTGPFIEMYLEKITDFKPTPGSNSLGVGTPYSKIYKKSYYRIYNFASSGSSSENYYKYNIKINSPYMGLSVGASDRSNTASDFKMVDQKMDDGAYNSGSVRTYCIASGKTSGYVSYDDVINDKGNTQQCSVIYYNIGF